MTARQELSRQRVGLASPDNSDTHDSNAGRGPASTRLQDCTSALPARPARQRRTRDTERQHRKRSYKLHIGGFSTRLETSCGGIGGGPEPAELQATQWRLRSRTGDVVRRRRWRTGAGGHQGSRQQESWTESERPELGLGELESAHCWTGTTCRAVPLACSDWSEESDVGLSLLDRVEGCGDNGNPGRTVMAAIQDVQLLEIYYVQLGRWL